MGETTFFRLAMLKARLAALVVLSLCDALEVTPQLYKQQPRRDAIASVSAALALTLLPVSPAQAQRSKLIPKSSAESTAAAKAYQLSKPGEESEEFKALEKRRADAAAGIAPQQGSDLFLTSDQKLLQRTLQQQQQQVASSKAQK